MSLGNLLVLIGMLLAVISIFADGFPSLARRFVLPVAVFCIALGILVGSPALVRG